MTCRRPLTRLRLRLENVSDEALRERLVGDLAAMQALVREGWNWPAVPRVPSSAPHSTWIHCWRASSRTPPKAAPTWSSRGAVVRC